MILLSRHRGNKVEAPRTGLLLLILLGDACATRWLTAAWPVPIGVGTRIRKVSSGRVTRSSVQPVFPVNQLPGKPLRKLHVPTRALAKSRRGAIASEVRRCRGMRLSRAGLQLLGRRQTRHNHQYHNHRQYRNDDIQVPGVFLGVYALPFFPFGHCPAPCCALQFRFLLDDQEGRLNSRDFTYLFAFFNLAIFDSDPAAASLRSRPRRRMPESVARRSATIAACTP